MIILEGIRMLRSIVICSAIMFALLAGGVHGAPKGGNALVDISKSRLQERSYGVSLQLALSQAVPYRIFSLDQPNRIVFEFFEARWPVGTAKMFQTDRWISSVEAGQTSAGRSLLVLTLKEPMDITLSDLRIERQSGEAILYASLEPVTAEVFATRVLGRDDAKVVATVTEGAFEKNRPVIVLDPGHGGRDLGATEGGAIESELMLTLALEIADELRRTEIFDVVLTRQSNEFVPLETRVAIAHQAYGDVFISLHADKVTQGRARGTTVYTLDEAAAQSASELITERHRQDEMIGGTDLTDQEDSIVHTLLEIARRDTLPRSRALAQFVLAGILKDTRQMNSNPLRTGGFSVLKSADIPSILIEAGFMSTPEDLENLLNPAWRKNFARGVTNGLLSWYREDLLQHETRFR